MISQQTIREWIDKYALFFGKSLPNAAKLIEGIEFHVVSERTWFTTRAEVVERIGSNLTNVSGTAMYEAILGDNGTAIIIRQKFVKNEREFRHALWHEMGHIYGVKYECPNENFHNEYLTQEGLHRDRLAQEGYWLWMEFIAESISYYVEKKYNKQYGEQSSNMDWYGLHNRLTYLLSVSLTYFRATIDEQTLGVYFATLSSNVYDVEDKEADVTAISEVGAVYIEPLDTLFVMLDTQLEKERFWEIDIDTLRMIGEQIQAMVLIKGQLLFRQNIMENK